MQEKLNKRVKSIAIVAAIIVCIVAIVFGISKYVFRVPANDKALNFNEYRIQSAEITVAPETYTGEEVTVTITPSILDDANQGKTGNIRFPRNV